MSRLFARGLLLLGLLMSMPVWAQEVPISGAEYFLNSDPGEGLGTAISGSFGGTTAELEFNVETSELEPGSHVVYVRMQDAEGVWGHPRSAALRVAAEETGEAPSIVAAEYFLNSDPGEGSGTAIDGSFDGATAELDFNVETSDLEPGSHVVHVRMQDEDGVWGRPRSAVLRVVAEEIEEAPSIVAAEYFLDSDPGEGSGTAIEGSFDRATVDLDFNVETSDLEPGSHVVHVRMQDKDGIWGRPRSAVLRVVAEETGEAPSIVAAEYFINSDPGEGSGTAIEGSFDGSTVDLEFDVETSDLEPGSHAVHVRMQDEDGVWGRPKPVVVKVTPAGEEPEAPAIVAAEYFIDHDPGEGSGIAIEGSFDGATVELEFDVETSDLEPGSHAVHVRMQDAEGIWGRPKPVAVKVTAADGEAEAPAIVAAEYFIDHDPGEGQATPLDPEDGAFDSATEVGEVEVSVEGLATGRHEVYVRMQDENGVWGRAQGRVFDIRETPSDGEAEHHIATAEYFIDTDPGEGNGIPMTPADGAFGGSFEDVAGQIETADLRIGNHTVFVRMQDEEGTWGKTRSIQFTVDEPPPEKPEMAVDDTGPHDFGTLRVDTKAEWTFTVSNAASAEDTLKVRSITVDAPFSVSPEAFSLAPGQSRRVVVTYFPTEEGTHIQKLVVRSNDTKTPKLEISLTGEAVPEQPDLVVSTPTNGHDFGAVRIGSTGEWTLVVSNEGVDTLRVLALSTEEPFAASPASFNVLPGESQEVSVTYEPTEEGVQSGILHIRSNDPDRRELDIQLSGEAVEFGVPVAAVTTPDGEQSGQVTIEFSIEDEDNSVVNAVFAYEMAGTQQTATVSGDTGDLTSDQYGGGKTLTVVWDTDTDLGSQDVVARFVITVKDADHPDGKQAITADFRVDNNLPPSAELTAPTDPVGRVVEVAYTLNDPEQDVLSLIGEYSTDGGTTWNEATIVNETTDITRYESSTLWDAFADLGYGSFAVRFRLTPSDNDPGSAGEAELTVTHLVGDYNGDQQIEFEDLTLFLMAWNRSPKDTNADIGPATGSVPDLTPAFDGALDFEDVVVLIQMWNWSVGLYPPASKPVLAQVGPDVLQVAEPELVDDAVRLDLRLFGGSLLAAGFEVHYDPEVWQLTEVTPGDAFPDPAGVLVLRRERAPGQVVVQLGSLSGPTREAGLLVQFHFAPKGQGQGKISPTASDKVSISYDLRDADGLRYGAGTLSRNIRPVPETFFLSANVPNPFNPSTRIAYGLPEPAVVGCILYDVLGRQVAMLLPQSFQRAGYYQISWDGRDALGREVGSGVYLVRLLARAADGSGMQVRTRRLMLLR